MKVVILAGGYGTRLSEETYLKPKPMIEIGEMPILWHIMKQYSFYGFNDFIICCGYKAYVIKEYFVEYHLRNSDLTIDFTNDNGSRVKLHSAKTEPWNVTLVDTGADTMTGGRVKRIAPYIGDEPFMLTYGDGVSDLNLKELEEFHKEHGKMVTITAVQPYGRFGRVEIDDDDVIHDFNEKPLSDGWINGGFMVVNPEFLKLIKGDSMAMEEEPLRKAAQSGELAAFKHQGFWKCMDTMKDKMDLEQMVKTNNAPWIQWSI